MKKHLNIFTLFKNYSNIFSSVPEDFPFNDELLEAENKWINRMALFHYTVWPSTFIFFFFVMGSQQTSKELLVYRLGNIFSLLLLGLIAYFFRKRTNVVKQTLILASAMMAISVSWSLTVGNPVESVSLILHATLIIASVSNSLFFALSWVVFLTLITEPFWGITFMPTKVYTVNLTIAFMIVIFAHVTKRVWVQSIVNKLLHSKSQKDLIKAQTELYTEVEKFVLPVLVKRIEEQTQKDKPLPIAVDDIMRRHQSDVAVLFSDIRDFSRRSTDMEFVEKELIPSSIKLIDMVEANGGVAKQIGDAIFAYYSTEGVHPDAPKEAILRAFKDAVIGCLVEKQRIKDLGRDKPERFFSVTYGPALVGNMASSRHREATVIGAPANLAARMDSLTKKTTFKPLIEDGNKILLSKLAKITMDYFEGALKFQEVNLESMNLIMNSFPDEKVIYLFAITKQNLTALNEILVTNDIDPIDVEDYI